MAVVPFIANVIGDQVVRYGRQSLSDLYDWSETRAAEAYARQASIERFRYGTGGAKSDYLQPGYLNTARTGRVTTHRTKARNMLVKYARKRPTKLTTGRGKYPTSTGTVLVRQPRAEIKSYYLDNAITGLSTTLGSLAMLSSIPQGSGVVQRDGYSTKLLDLRWSGIMEKAGGTAAYTAHRILIFVWNQGYVTPTVLSVLETASYLSTYSNSEARNYKILYDKTTVLNAHAGVAGAYGANAQIIRGYVRVPLSQIYSTTSGTTADRNVYVLAISNSVDGTVNISSCLRFIEQ